MAARAAEDGDVMTRTGRLEYGQRPLEAEQTRLFFDLVTGSSEDIAHGER